MSQARAPGARFAAYDLFYAAMSCYEQAENLRLPENDDATLRWNACVRIIQEQHLKPRLEERLVLTLE